MATKNTAAKPEKVEVELIKHHTHAGEKKEPGAKIKVAPRQVSWLQKRGIIDKPAA